MPGLAILSPINENDELSPYRTRFGYARYPGQRSPISATGPFLNVQDTAAGPSSPEMTVDDIWIYDCYVSEDATSPADYPRSPSTPSHNRSISLPASTSNYLPPNNTPLIKEPNPHRPPALSVPSRDMLPGIVDLTDGAGVVEYPAADLDLPVINTAIFSPAEYPEYSPLEQEAFSTWEVIDQLAAAVDQFSGLESVLSHAGSSSPLPELDEDTVFWFIEALNIFVGDCREVAMDLMKFSEFVDALLTNEHDRFLPPVSTLPRASFSEQDMQEVLKSAANIPKFEVVEALAELEATVPPSTQGRRTSRDRPPSLKLSTNDAVLLQARIRPRSRLQSVGALGRYSEQETPQDNLTDATLKKHRAYVIYGDTTPVEDNWSAKSIVDYDVEEFPIGGDGQSEQSPRAPRPRPTSGQSAIPRPLSSPVSFGPKILAARNRPPSLTLSDPHSPHSSHSASSSISSLFSALPRSSFTTNSSPRSSPRQSVTFDKGDKSRFPASSVKFKKMFTNIFKNKDGTLRSSSIRPFGRRTAGTGSIDATLSALGMSAPSSLSPDRDPFAASPPPPPPAAPRPPNLPRFSDASALDGYSSMFNSLKTASRYPTQPLFQGIQEDL